MYDGMSFLIHNKESYESNRNKLIKLFEKTNMDLNDICNASVVEFREDLYLIIDGHTSILDSNFTTSLAKIICPKYKEDTKLTKGLCDKFERYCSIIDLKDMDIDNNDFIEMMNLPKPETEEERNLMEKMNLVDVYLDSLLELGNKKGKVITPENFNREFLYTGVQYSYGSPITYKMFNIEKEPELLEDLAAAIFKATTEKTSVGEVRFVETLFDTMP
jgi:hypothetical protein